MFLRSFASAACVASLVARADCLKTASDVNYTLGGWQSTAVSGQLSLAQASANVQIGLPPLAGGNGNGLTCGFLVAPGDAGRDLGDAWAQVNPTSPYAAKVRAATPGTAIPLPSTELQGAAVWLLRDFLSTYNVTVNFKAVTPPLNLTYPNTSDPTPSIIFALDDMARSPASQHSPLPFVHLKYTGLDCLAWLVPLTTGPMSVLSYSVPLLSASYVVVGRRPAPPPTEIRDHVKMAFIPFTGYTWLLVAGILLTSATAMMAFEWGKKEATGHPWDKKRSPLMHIVSFIGVAAVTMTGHGFFEPGTAAGRAYAAFKAFFVVILWGVFIGNMTAYLVVLPKYVEPVASIDDFATTGGVGTPACLLDRPDVKSYMQAYQPFTPTRTLPTQRPFDLVRAVSTGDCDGAVLYDLEFADALGGELNPRQEFCNVEIKGLPLTSLTYAMPFSQRLGLGSFGFPLPGQAPDPQWWTAINKLFLYSMESSQFQLKGVAPWFDPMPDVCMPAMDAGQDLRQINFLQLTELDLSGIFLLQIGGAVLAIIVHLCTFAVIRVQRVHSKARHHNGDPERAPEAAKIGAIMND